MVLHRSRPERALIEPLATLTNELHTRMKPLTGDRWLSQIQDGIEEAAKHAAETLDELANPSYEAAAYREFFSNTGLLIDFAPYEKLRTSVGDIARVRTTLRRIVGSPDAREVYERLLARRDGTPDPDAVRRVRYMDEIKDLETAKERLANRARWVGTTDISMLSEQLEGEEYRNDPLTRIVRLESAPLFDWGELRRDGSGTNRAAAHHERIQ